MERSHEARASFTTERSGEECSDKTKGTKKGLGRTAYKEKNENAPCKVKEIKKR